MPATPARISHIQNMITQPVNCALCILTPATPAHSIVAHTSVLLVELQAKREREAVMLVTTKKYNADGSVQVLEVRFA